MALVENRPIVPARKSLLSRLANRDNGGGTKGPTFCPGPLTSSPPHGRRGARRGHPLLSRLVTQTGTKGPLRGARRILLL